MIVDTRLVSVGSTNFDNRSFHLNDEATLNILDPAFAAEQTRIVEADLALARQVTLAAWTNRPWREKASDALASMIGSQL
jgi:cardiolipin synthase